MAYLVRSTRTLLLWNLISFFLSSVLVGRTYSAINLQPDTTAVPVPVLYLLRLCVHTCGWRYLLRCHSSCCWLQNEPGEPAVSWDYPSTLSCTELCV